MEAVRPRLAAIAFWLVGNSRHAIEHVRGQQRRVQEDPDALGYHLMAGGSGAPSKPNPLLDVAPEEVWREIEREALS